MQLNFFKYQGTGNDFILIDNRDFIIDSKDISLIEKICDRRFGVGGDGLMLLENEENFDFRMRYFNSNGKEASMCGNGGRCIVAFAYHLGIITDSTSFIAVDGEHKAKILNNKKELLISLQMQNISKLEIGEDYFYLNTGSPHFVKFIPNHNNFDTYSEGRKIRNNDRFKKEGTNVNFVSFQDDSIMVSTFERGVEDETYSCGTGVVAAAISASFKTKNQSFKIITKGGNLKVNFEKIDSQNIKEIWLTGPAKYVFTGKFNL
ncbi:diaminopimelate epimerase [Ancylomarina longa]|uniref:Diaminopimelate epimerase n=1 Tax=Ancylomarina longa TaxID=2487017 RepID=A0A434AUT5_9BACT|nr:diaminopimelate epimerase [Ancylomarina longa]RUT78234.1 diaminopimelate epimerase [Ancylomarina longa]